MYISLVWWSDIALFVDFRKRAQCCRPGIFLWVQCQKIGNFWVQGQTYRHNFLRPCVPKVGSFKKFIFWNWGPTTIWHSLASAQFFSSKSLHPIAQLPYRWHNTTNEQFCIFFNHSTVQRQCHSYNISTANTACIEVTPCPTLYGTFISSSTVQCSLYSNYHNILFTLYWHSCLSLYPLDCTFVLSTVYCSVYP